MTLRLCVAGSCVVLAQAAFGGDPPHDLERPAAVVAKPAAAMGRKQLEVKLQTPAKLELAGRKQVTIREVLNQLHQQHQISLRFDTPTLTSMLEIQTDNVQETLSGLLDIEIDVQTSDLSRISIATVIRQALDAVPVPGADHISGMPILLTNAMLLDYLVEDDGLLITSRMKTLTTKETRVYSIKHLRDLPPEQLAKTIRQSIRPWSWRSQINDLGDQLRGTPLPAEPLTSLLKTGIQLVGAENGISVNPIYSGGAQEEPKRINHVQEAQQMEMLGSALANGLVTLAQSTLLALEMAHYAEPPTGTIQTLGGKLIVTQSQAVHREIAELLKQLTEE